MGGRGVGAGRQAGGGASSLTQLVLVLFAETVSGGEEVPASLLVHLPHIGFLEENRSRLAFCADNEVETIGRLLFNSPAAQLDALAMLPSIPHS